MATHRTHGPHEQATPQATTASPDQGGDRVLRIELLELVSLALFLVLAVIMAHVLLA